MEQRVCTYCGNPLEPGTGRMFVKRDGTVYYFDKQKCRRGLIGLKRVPRHVKWTRHYPRAGHDVEEELAQEQAEQMAEIAEQAEEAGIEAPAKPSGEGESKAEKKAREAEAKADDEDAEDAPAEDSSEKEEKAEAKS